jgi:hypothetical protein
VVALGLYPHFVVHRTERDTTDAIAKARQAGAPAEVSSIR